MKNLVTYSKAKSLIYAGLKVSQFKVPELLHFNAILFKNNPSSIIKKIKDTFQERVVVIRSSAADEDGQSESSAGEYDSILNIPCGNTEKITTAINTVISSYERKRPLLVGDEVIIQEMVLNTIMSGVIFTHDLNTGAPYYVINYDDQSGLTDTVTSGNGEYANRTLYIHRNSINQLKSERFIKLLQAVQELEQVMESQFLDIEFALREDLTPYLLQVRAITTKENWNRAVSKRIDSTLQSVYLFVTEHFKTVPGVYGKTTVLGQMPDWNPVEMIGRAPRALATSLYQVLITDNAWQKARAIMDYSIPTGQPLMLMLAGQPFIDTRLSFHSYLPNTISPEISEKLVSHWVKQLKAKSELHDKIEFEVAITAYSFEFNEKMERLIGNALTTSEKTEFRRAHLEQTKKLMKGKGAGSIGQALDKIGELNSKQSSVNNTTIKTKLSSLFSMVEDCIDLGTVPFSILARHGFIAKTIILSLSRCGIITIDEVNKIQASVHTVASDLVMDMHSLQKEEISNLEFMEKYGHLRPGTYDIKSHRYDQMGDFSSGNASILSEQPIASFQFSQKQRQQVNKLLEIDGFDDFNADNLLDYVREAIIAREYGKFIFTRSVSDMLELIANFAQENGLSRDEASHIPLNAWLDILRVSGKGSIEERLRRVSEEEADKHDISKAIRLPQLLVDKAGVHIIPFQVSHPNFITQKQIMAPSVILRSEIEGVVLKGKVIIIEGADPGFDWIFSQNIAGLVTKYGGANSHMAIRCAEFEIPAAIGCGEQRYEQLLKARKVHLDCAAGLISPLH